MAPEGERLRLVAFCEEDYKPMAQVLKGLEASFPTKLDGRRQNRKVTMEQIESLKTGKKAAAASRRPRKAAVAP